MLKIDMNEVQIKIRVTQAQHDAIKLYKQLLGFKTSPALMKSILLGEVTKLPNKIDALIKKAERKVDFLEKKLGGKTKAVRDRAYQQAFDSMNKLIQAREDYENLIVQTFPKPNPIKLVIDSSNKLPALR